MAVGKRKKKKKTLTRLVGQNPVQAESAGDGALAAIRAHGPLAGADIVGILLEVPILGLLVPTEPRRPGEAHSGGSQG